MRSSLIRPSDEEVLRYGRARGWPPMRGAADWRTSGGMDYETLGFNYTNVAGTNVTASGTANTKGSWTQVTAATARNATGLVVHALGGTGNVLMDIGIGAAGSEQVVVPNLFTSLSYNTSTGNSTWSHYIPVGIPAGSRIAIRQQSSTGGGISSIGLVLVEEGFTSPPAFSRVTDYGTDLTNSRGTQPTLTTGGKGGWAQLAASTNTIRSLLVVAFGPWASTAWQTLTDIAIGAAGAEQVLIPDIFMASPAQSTAQPPAFFSMLFPVNVPSGSRLAARTDRSGTSLNYVACYGLE